MKVREKVLDVVAMTAEKSAESLLLGATLKESGVNVVDAVEVLVLLENRFGIHITNAEFELLLTMTIQQIIDFVQEKLEG